MAIPTRKKMLRRPSLNCIAVAGLLAAVAFVLPAEAGAWTTARVVSPSNVQTGSPDLASGSTGWTALSFTRSLTSDPSQVQVAIRRPRATRFGAPRLVSDRTLVSDDAQVAVAPDGQVTVAWLADAPPPSGDIVVMVASKSKSARRFSRPLRLSPLGMGGDPENLSISVGEKGRTVVAWAIEDPDGDMIVQSARRSTGKSRFSRPTRAQEVSIPSSRPDNPSDAGVTALVAADGSYNYQWTGAGSIEYVRISGRSIRRQTISSFGNEREGVLAIARNGAATSAWTTGDGKLAVARRGSARGSFSIRNAFLTDAGELRIGMARDGATTIVYRTGLGIDWQPVAITRRPNQDQFGSEQFISPLGGYNPDVAVSPNGKVRVVFGGSASFLAPGVVQRGPRASSFGSPFALGLPEGTDSVTVTTGGDGWSTAAWAYLGTGSRVVYSVARP